MVGVAPARHLRVGLATIHLIDNTFDTSEGRANFGFVDGHVEGFGPPDLFDDNTERSNYAALWSPLDRRQERDLEPDGG